MKNTFAIGNEVTATPKDGDFAHEFTGIVVGFRDDFVLVKDQDDDVFCCEPCQLEHAD